MIDYLGIKTTGYKRVRTPLLYFYFAKYGTIPQDDVRKCQFLRYTERCPSRKGSDSATQWKAAVEVTS